MSRELLRAPLPSLFAETYREARVKFQAAAEQGGYEIQSLVHPLKGLNGEELAIDVVIVDQAGQAAESAPQKTVIVSSGLHGVEGYFGSAVQIALLQLLPELSVPQGLRLVIVHGLNPWGFSHVRRFDHENIDCNRNFLLPGEEYQGSPELYSQIDSFLNPKRLPRGIDGFHFQAISLIRQFGLPPLQQAVVSGQYDFPEGLFYGGSQPSWTFNQFQEHWEAWTGNAAQVVHLDLHSGLGKFAQGKCMIDGEPEQDELDWLMSIVGEENLGLPAPGERRNNRQDSEAQQAEPQITADEASAPYDIRGGLGRWCQESYQAGRYFYVCLEFGTFRALRVLKKLRLENQAYHYCPATTPRLSRFKRKLRRMFCPNRKRWQRKTVAQSLEWIVAAVEQPGPEKG